MKFNEFKENVIKWGLERKIIPNSSFNAQYIKLVEELGELALGIRKRDETVIKDSIGDVAVVLTIIAGLKKMSEQVFLDKIDKIEELSNFEELCENIGRIPLYAKPYKGNREGLKTLISYSFTLLKGIAKEQNLDFMECCEYAWNEIKNRKGYLREDGIFIKEADYKQPEPVKYDSNIDNTFNYPTNIKNKNKGE